MDGLVKHMDGLVKRMAARMPWNWARDPQVVYIVIFYLASVVFGAAQHVYSVRRNNNDEISALSRMYVGSAPFQCNGWSVLHLVLYTCLGFFAPSYWHVLIIIGALFEVFEEVGAKAGVRVFEEPPHQRFLDILVNALGVGAGVLVRRLTA